MYTSVTRNIQVTVLPEFQPERSNPEQGQFFWVYTIEIANHGETDVQLMHRHWKITDSNGHLEEIRGPGVVGERPMLKPGESFRYTSGCPLRTASGIMSGDYRMIDKKGVEFLVEIPAFSLDSPFAKRVLN